MDTKKIKFWLIIVFVFLAGCYLAFNEGKRIEREKIISSLDSSEIISCDGGSCRIEVEEFGGLFNVLCDVNHTCNMVGKTAEQLKEDAEMEKINKSIINNYLNDKTSKDLEE